MIFPYRQYEVLPTPGNSAGFLYRPLIPIRVIGPTGVQVVLGLVDTGSDVTVLPSFLLPIIGAAFNAEESAVFRGVGGQEVTAHYSSVHLALDHADGSYRWPATIGFLDGRDVAILGYSGFLEHFQATFNSERHRLTLKPNKHFPGTVRS
jgi:hypothetical protein